MANRGLGIYCFCCILDSLLRNLLSFALLLLFLLWLRRLGDRAAGGAVAYAHQHFRFYEGERELLVNSPAGREKLALHMMFLIGAISSMALIR